MAGMQRLNEMMGDGWCKYMSGVYAIVDVMTDKVLYVGSSHMLPDRLSKHMWALDHNDQHPRYQTCDGQRPVFKILEFLPDVSRAKLLKREQHYINTYEPQGNLVGNIRKGRELIKAPRKEYSDTPELSELTRLDAIAYHAGRTTQWIGKHCTTYKACNRLWVRKEELEDVLGYVINMDD